MTSCRRDNWDKKCEDAVNNQINLEFWASYQYHLMWSYFDRSTVGLNNIADFFKKSSDEEREHAHKLMKYQNLRGGIVKFSDIKKVSLEYLGKQDSEYTLEDVITSFKKAMDMEQTVYESLLTLHHTGEECQDPQFTDFIEGAYLKEQIYAQNELAKYVSQLQRIGTDGHGIWNFNNLMGAAE
jgi:ferritin heavy chain